MKRKLLQRISELPDNLLKSLDVAMDIDSGNLDAGSYRHILVVGMGSIGVGCNILDFIIKDLESIGYSCNDDYTVPSFVNEKVLIVCGFLPNKEKEALNVLEKANKFGSHLVVIGAGNQLKRFKEGGARIVIELPSDIDERTAIGHALIPLANVLNSAGVAPVPSILELVACEAELKKNHEEITKQAIELAGFMYSKSVAYFNVPELEDVCNRERLCSVENTNVLCWYQMEESITKDELNEWTDVMEDYSVIFLEKDSTSGKIKHNMEYAKSIIADKSNIISIKSKGNNHIQHIFYNIYLLDLTAYYLKCMSELDPIDEKILE